MKKPAPTVIPKTSYMAEQAAGEPHQYLRTILNNMRDAVFVHDLAGRVLDVNTRVLAMYDVTREEAMSRTIWNGFSASDNAFDKLAPLWERAVAGENQLFQWKARRPKDGFVFDVEVFLTGLSLPEGTFILANVRDITSQKKAEQELRATRRYLRTVFNNVYDAIFVHDQYGKVIDVNDKLLSMYGVTREEAIDLRIIPDYSTPDHTVEKMLSVWKRALSGEDQFFEWKAKRPKDGSAFDVEVFLTKLLLPEGNYILANVRDITERKKVEELLRKEREVFFSVMRNNPHGIALTNQEGQFIYVNPKFTAITGYSLDDIPTSQDWASRAYPDADYRKKVIEVWKKDQMPEGGGKDVEFIIVCKDGQRKDVEFRQTYLGDRNLVVLTDTTARNIAERELRAEKQRLQERNLELEVLNDIITSVGSSLRLPEMLETLTRIFSDKLQVDSGGVFVYDEPADSMRMEAFWGIPEGDEDTFVAFALECYDQEIAHRNGKRLQSRETSFGRRRPDRSDELTVSVDRNVFCMPLVANGEAQGFILLTYGGFGGPRDDQEIFYRTLARQVGLAVQKARLFKQVQQSHEEMKALSLRLVAVQEQERRRIARELHDQIGQELTGLRLSIEMSELQTSGETKAGLTRAKAIVNGLVGIVRELSLRLRPYILDDLGLLPTLLWHFQRFTNQTGIRVAFKHTGIDGTRLPLELETAVFRIVQEALTNAARHAEVSDIIVRLWSDGSLLTVQVEDHGVGFDMEAPVRSCESSGLNGMRERAVLLGGRFSLESQPSAGTRLTAELPVWTNEGHR